MRVLQLITDTDRRGAQVFAVDLQEELRRLGNHVTTVALVPGRSSGGLPVDVLAPSRWSLKGQMELRRLARSHDVVIAHGSSTAVASTFSLGRTRTPVVYRQISDSRTWASTWVRRIRVQAYLSQMRHVVALWTGSAQDLTEYLRVPQAKITIIPNGVRADVFDRTLPASSKRDEGSRPRIGYLGALAEEKGVSDLRWLAEQLPEVDVVLAGDGPMRPSLLDGAPSNLELLGPVGDPAAFLAGLDCFVFPSWWGDSMPAAIIEAALVGLPSVVTDVGAAREMVIDGRTGFVVDPRDRERLLARVRELLGDRELSESFVAEACVHVQKYSIAAVGVGYHRLIHRLVA